MGRLDGKVAVITGAAGGIGREAALLFSAEGAGVCVADVLDDEGERTAADCREAFFAHVDVTDPESVRAMYAAAAERYGGIDVLYNNAGIMPADDASILDTEPEAWQRVQDVNVKGVFLGCKYGIPHLLERGGGSVINVASFVALLGAATSQISYTASKGAVLSMTRELAVEFARRGVRVNALCPGPVETPLLMRLFENDPEAYERRRVHLPMGRLAQAREIAERRALPRERRGLLRDRGDLRRRRRADRRLRHGRVARSVAEVEGDHLELLAVRTAPDRGERVDEQRQRVHVAVRQLVRVLDEDRHLLALVVVGQDRLPEIVGVAVPTARGRDAELLARRRPELLRRADVAQVEPAEHVAVVLEPARELLRVRLRDELEQGRPHFAR